MAYYLGIIIIQGYLLSIHFLNTFFSMEWGPSHKKWMPIRFEMGAVFTHNWRTRVELVELVPVAVSAPSSVVPFSNLALLLIVKPTFLLKLIMPRLLRRGKLLIRLLGVLLKLDVGTSINFFLTWVLGGAFGLAGPRLAEPTVPTGPSLRM